MPDGPPTPPWFATAFSPVFGESTARKIEEQATTIAQLKSGMEDLTVTMKEQAAQIQKVSAKLEVSKATPGKQSVKLRRV